MEAIAHQQRAAGAGRIGRAAKRRVGAKANIANIDLVSAREAGDLTGEVLRIVERERPPDVEASVTSADEGSLRSSAWPLPITKLLLLAQARLPLEYAAVQIGKAQRLKM